MDNYPKLGTPILYGIVGLTLLVIAVRETNPLGWGATFRYILVVIGAFLFFIALATLANWIADNFNYHRDAYRKTSTLTVQLRIAEVIRGYTLDQIKLLSLYAPQVEALAGSRGPVLSLRNAKDPIPYEVIHDWLDRSERFDAGGKYTFPVRNYGEGTSDYQYITDLITYFTQMGFLAPAAGNRSARWLDYEGALIWLGMAKPVQL